MIELTQPKPVKSKQIAAGITAGILLVVYIGLSFWNIKQPIRPLEIYAKLDWYKFTPMPQPKPIKEVKKESGQKEQPKDIENTIKKMPAPRKVDVDLNELRQILKIDQNPMITTRPQQKPKATANPTMDKISINELLPQEVMEPLFKGDGPNLPIPSGIKSKKSSGQTTSLDIANAGNTSSSQDISSLQKTGTVLSGPGGKSTGDKPIQEISLKDLSSFGSNYSDLNSIFKPLVDWMKKHPAPHPPAIVSLTRQNDMGADALRSMIEFRVGDRNFTLYLKCIESLYEIHIVLIENTNLAYLIDQGFKKRSHFLRLGTANYADESMTKLVSCNTTYEKPSDKRTKEFYQIFHSWWDSIKDSIKDESKNP